MALPDWNNDKASPPIPFSVCSPDKKELEKRSKVLREALMPVNKGTIANPDVK